MDVSSFSCLILFSSACIQIQNPRLIAKNLFHLKKVIFDPISSKVAAVPVQNLLYGNLRQRQLVWICLKMVLTVKMWTGRTPSQGHDTVLWAARSSLFGRRPWWSGHWLATLVMRRKRSKERLFLPSSKIFTRIPGNSIFIFNLFSFFFAPKALYFSTSNKVLGLCSLTGPTAFSPACCRCLRAPPSRSTPHFAL